MKPGTARITVAFLLFAFVMLIFPIAMLPEPVNYVFVALFWLVLVAIAVILLVFWRCSYCRPAFWAGRTSPRAASAGPAT